MDAQNQQILQIARGYWEALRTNGSLPVRDAINPRGLETALPHALILQRIAPGLARFRIAGMHLADLMGMDVRGMPLSSLFDPDARTQLAEALEMVFAKPAILSLTLEAERGIGRPMLGGQLLMMPVLDAEGQPTLAFGCLVTSGNIGRSPRRFVISRCQITPLGVPGLTPAKPVQRSHGLAEHPTAFVPATAAPAPAKPPARAKDRTYLRLVKSDS